jgi:hypothetical protein
MVFTANVNAVTSYGMSGAACGARLRASAAGGCGPHGSKSRTTTATKSSARTGCDRSTSTTLLCHSERSEESFPLRTKGRLRTMPSKEERDKRSAVKNLSTYTFIQILRRSAPQNDKTGRTARRTTRWDQTIHCSQTPQQAGISNWRQRRKVEGKDVRSGRGV